ncbi:hypothetical protein BC739_002516 [Kutzneria viridogrisea]|uniref:Uncharacterized protein n=1 Tax=Kutzneria viridogrisea TaxID=47990 RepID=A0ABR6BEP5_9PSEU|nr:hypothetical protein [Kutzneria viridogrisea]
MSSPDGQANRMDAEQQTAAVCKGLLRVIPPT